MSRKRISVVRVVNPSSTVPNEQWSMDLISNSLHEGRRFRVLTSVDHFSRESTAIEVGRSIPGVQVVTVLERLTKTTRLPKVITGDNGRNSPTALLTNAPTKGVLSWTISNRDT